MKRLPAYLAIWMGASALLLASLPFFPPKTGLRFGLVAAGVTSLLAASLVAAVRLWSAGGASWERAKTVAEIIKTTIEVVAILIGAVWAYTHFVAFEEPTLHVDADRKAVLTSWRDPRGLCHARLAVTLKNLGVTPIMLDHVEIEVYPFLATPPDGGTVLAIDHTSFKHAGVAKPMPEMNRSFAYGAKLAQGESWFQEIEWVLASPSRDHEYMFRALFFLDKDETATYAPSDWGYVCAAQDRQDAD